MISSEYEDWNHGYSVSRRWSTQISNISMIQDFTKVVDFVEDTICNFEINFNKFNLYERRNIADNFTSK
jgi:hypothetical protein